MGGRDHLLEVEPRHFRILRPLLMRKYRSTKTEEEISRKYFQLGQKIREQILEEGSQLR